MLTNVCLVRQLTENNMLLFLAAHVGALKEAGGAPESALQPSGDGVAQLALVLPRTGF